MLHHVTLYSAVPGLLPLCPACYAILRASLGSASTSGSCVTPTLSIKPRSMFACCSHLRGTGSELKWRRSKGCLSPSHSEQGYATSSLSITQLLLSCKSCLGSVHVQSRKAAGVPRRTPMSCRSCSVRRCLGKKRKSCKSHKLQVEAAKMHTRSLELERFRSRCMKNAWISRQAEVKEEVHGRKNQGQHFMWMC